MDNAPVLKAMISSTARDLPEHRAAVEKACLRQSFFPVMMESLAASDEDAISASLKMVDESDVYIGIFAHRYGYVPRGHDISITEMECNRAEERGIPRLIFLMDEEHKIKISDVDVGAALDRLRDLKNRLASELLVNFFKSPEDLQGQVINTLAQHRGKKTPQHRHLSDVPAPPEVYIAHPYTLLQTNTLIGRQKHLNLLTDWVSKPGSEIYSARILNVVAIGGMGKSALTWSWFNEIAPQEMPALAGRMWWSFYERDADFDQFVISALAYVTQRPREEVGNIPLADREAQLLGILDKQPFLFVLDGMERILVAYARMDAARLLDDELDEKTANRVAGAMGLPDSAVPAFIRQHHLRKTADPHVGTFLQKLARVRKSSILVSTRLYPADLQTDTGLPVPGSAAMFLEGLSDDDALNLWRALGVRGSRDSLIPLFHSFGNYPLLIRSLAGAVAQSRRAAGDYDVWRQKNPGFDPFNLELKQARTHVLDYALRRLGEPEGEVLNTLAAFRMPASYDTLAALFVESENVDPDKTDLDPAVMDDLRSTVDDWRPSTVDDWFPKPLDDSLPPTSDELRPWVDSYWRYGDAREKKPKIFHEERELDRVLEELEDRGLIGWDKRNNRYDLHPVVRGVVWSKMTETVKTGVYSRLEEHFTSIPSYTDDGEDIEQLDAAIELYNALIQLGRFHEAYYVYADRIDETLRTKVAKPRAIIELLSMLFPDGLDQKPRADETDVLLQLALAYQQCGMPGEALPLHERHNTTCPATTCLLHAAYIQDSLGQLYKSETTCLNVIKQARSADDYERHFNEAFGLIYLSSVLRWRGLYDEAMTAVRRARKLQSMMTGSRDNLDYSLQRLDFWMATQSEDWQLASTVADKLWHDANKRNEATRIIYAAMKHGDVAVHFDDLERAEERFSYGLRRARECGNILYEMSCLRELAEVRWKRGDDKNALDLIAELVQYAERGPYPLSHASALNLKAKIAHKQGDRETAIQAATEAYRLSWCDGPPFVYKKGLDESSALLHELGAPEPVDVSSPGPQTFAPPSVAINPRDEFHVDEARMN